MQNAACKGVKIALRLDVRPLWIGRFGWKGGTVQARDVIGSAEADPEEVPPQL